MSSPRRNTADYWFGRKPPAGAALAWGARGNIEGKGSKTIIHFPPSNQQWTEGTTTARKSLSSWINRVGLKEIKRDGVLFYGDGHEVITFVDGNREIQASRQGSNSNVYVGAWEFAKPSRAATRNGRGARRNTHSDARLYPGSPRDATPLDSHTHGRVWDAGYEAASWANRQRMREVEVTDLFLRAIHEIGDRRIPRNINEDNIQFWEYVGAFSDGAKAYARDYAKEPLRRIIVR